MKIIRSALVGGIVLFVWGFVWWTVLPWHRMTLKTFNHEWALLPWVSAASNGSGIYLLPSPSSKPGASQAEASKHAFAFVAYSAEGSGPMGPKMALQFAVNALLAGLAAWLLGMSGVQPYFRRVIFVKTLGVFAALAVCLPQWIWWGFSPGFTLVSFLNLGIGWFLAGLLIAWLA